MRKITAFLLILIFAFVLFPGVTGAQGELAAVLEVTAGGVEVQRVNTSQWIPVSVEAIVGVGDTIRTDNSGRARIIFFADGTDTELLSNTEYRIEQFEGDDSGFNLSVSVLAGQTTQRVNRLLDENSTYDIETPGMEMAARGTEFQVRVEDDGRAAMLVSEGDVAATAEGDEASVSPGYGVRSAQGETLSDVVAATTFEELDSGLDGCAVTIRSVDDMWLNVRQGPGTEFPRVGAIAPDEVVNLMGVVEGDAWYRIEFRDGFGWILSSSASVEETCAGLRQFAADYGPEDPTLYSSLGEAVSLDDLMEPGETVEPSTTEEPADEATPEAESESGSN